MTRLRVYEIYFPVQHCVGVTNMFLHYNLSRCEDIIYVDTGYEI